MRMSFCVATGMCAALAMAPDAYAASPAGWAEDFAGAEGLAKETIWDSLP